MSANIAARGWIVVGSAVLVGLLACSAESLWIDEAWMGLLAAEPDLTGWWRRMQETGGSTMQMPLYTLYLWLWEKIAGSSEWALRAANIPPFTLAQWALFRAFRDEKPVRFWLVIVAGMSPFVWSYMTEARPYILQYCGASLVVAAVVCFARRQRVDALWTWLFCAGAILLCGSSVLGFPWAGMAVVALLVLRWPDGVKPLLRDRQLAIICFTAMVLLVIFIYDAWTFLHDAKASSVGRTSAANLLYAVYELLGFAGLGPGRLPLRESPSLATLIPYAPALGALAAALALLVFVPPRGDRRLFLALLLYGVVPALFVTALAVVSPFRLLGRHLTPVVPVLFVLVALSAAQPWKAGLHRAFLVLWLISALLLRFHPRHARDDYRAAAALTRESLDRGNSVWWAADSAGAEYYRLPLAAGAEPAAATLAINKVPGPVPPDLVLLSKPDIYDASGELQRFLAEHNYRIAQRLPAFTAWRRE